MGKTATPSFDLKEAAGPAARRGSLPHLIRTLLSRREHLTPTLMVAPAALFSVLMVGFPFAYAAYLALTDFRLASTMPVNFVGLGNFARALQDPVFHRALQVTLTIYAIALTLEVVLGTYAGILLGQKLRGVSPLRMLAFAPAVIPSVAVGLIFVQMYDPAQGLMNYLLKTVGLKPQPWLSDPRTAVPSIILVEVWQWTPFITLIVTGAMQALPIEPFESAVIDGASSLQILRYITLPLLKPAILVAAMLRTVDLMRIFDSIYIMTQGGPVNASMSLNVYAFTQGILFSQIGYASSIMLVLLCMVLLTSGLFSIIRARSAL